MKIGIDFGTSYTSAAAYKDGRVQHILFEGKKQFRTAAFFPDCEVDLTAFRLTEHDENEVSRSISATKADYSRRL